MVVDVMCRSRVSESSCNVDINSERGMIRPIWLWVILIVCTILLPVHGRPIAPIETPFLTLSNVMSAIQTQFEAHFGLAGNAGFYPNNRLSSMPTSDRELFQEFATLRINNGKPGDYRPGSMIHNAINNLLQCLQVDDVEEFTSDLEPVHECMVTGKKCEECLDLLPAVQRALAEQWCLTLMRDPVFLAAANLWNDKNWLPEPALAERAAKAVRGMRIEDETPFMARIPKFTSPTMRSVRNAMLSGGAVSLSLNSSQFMPTTEFSFLQTTSKSTSPLLARLRTSEQLHTLQIVTAAYLDISWPAWLPLLLIDQAHAQQASRRLWKRACNPKQFFAQLGELPTGMMVIDGLGSTLLASERFNETEQDQLRVLLSTDPSLSIFPFRTTVPPALSFDQQGRLTITSPPSDLSLILGYRLAPLYGRARSVPWAKSQQIHRTLGIENMDEVDAQVALLKKQVGPVLAASLRKPSCGVLLFNCLHDLLPHGELLVVARKGDLLPLLEAVGELRLCECVACLPDAHEATARQLLHCPESPIPAPSLPTEPVISPEDQEAVDLLQSFGLHVDDRVHE